MTIGIPEQSVDAMTIERELDALLDEDYRRISLRAGRLTYWALSPTAVPEEGFMEVSRRAAARFAFESQFYLTSQPSIIKMSADILAMIKAGLDGGDPGVVGTITMGGTESNTLAVKAAREWARGRRGWIDRPNIVVPYSAHPSFNKAAEFMDMTVTRVPVRDDFTADVQAMAEAISPDTVMIAASAPSYTHGTIDPVEALGKLAQERDLWLHVDACVGGVILPFMRKAGQAVPPFDFAVPGVCSVSADLHKHGYTPVGISTLFCRDEAMRKGHTFTFDEWPNGLHRSPTFNSSRPAAPLAGAWATLRSLGQPGYLDLAQRIIAMRDRMIAGIRSIPGLRVYGQPNATMFTYGSDTIDAFAIGDELTARGWHCFATERPRGQHIIIDAFRDATIIDDYLGDLAVATEAVRGRNAPAVQRGATYG